MSRVVDESLHGEVTQIHLREIRERVADGYEHLYRQSGWAKLSQLMLKDIHFLLTFFNTSTADHECNGTNCPPRAHDHRVLK